jgi:hypothetical protein
MMIEGMTVAGKWALTVSLDREYLELQLQTY